MHKPEPEMMKAAPFVRYEWDQFTWAADEARSKRPTDPVPIGWFAGTGDQSGDDNALVEDFLLHARALRDFFGRRRAPLKPYEQTDMVAEDFFDAPGDWTLPTFGFLSQPSNVTRINRSLAHLSYDRIGYELPSKEWDFQAIWSELNGAWDAVRAALPEDRRLWFDG